MKIEEIKPQTSDSHFLMWLHERLEHVHGEDPLFDYMHKLRSIINSSSDTENSQSRSANSLEELIKYK